MKRRVEPEPYSEDYPRGLVLSISGLGSGLDREAVKAACETFGGVGWVEYKRDASEAFVRFTEAVNATAAAGRGADSAPDVVLEGHSITAMSDDQSKYSVECPCKDRP